MQLQTIGNLDMFAIEHDTTYEYGPDLLKLRIKIAGAVLGTLETATYLPTFIDRLEGLIVDPDTLGEYTGAGFEYESLHSLGESFDDFLIEKTRTAEWLFLRYKLVNTPFFQYAGLQPGQVYECKATMASVLAVREELLQFWQTTAPRT